MQIEGRNPVLELLRTDKEISAIHLQHHINQDTKINAIVKKARKKQIKILRRNRKALNKMSKTGSHQGVIAVYKRIEELSLNELIDQKRANNEAIRAIYIREAYHEHNIGAIVRSAEAAGFDAIILPPKLNVTPQVVRASMGATEHMRIFSESLFPLLKNFKSLGIQLVGIERTEESTVYTDANLTGDVLLIIGGEDRELSPQIISKIDQTVEIPMEGKVNSLNMSVAAALVIFEVVRQKTKDSK